MFLRYLDPLFAPWRALRNKITQVRSIKGNIQVDVHRVQRFGKMAQQNVAKAKNHLQQAPAQAQGQMQGAQAAHGQAQKAHGQFIGQQPPYMVPGMQQGQGQPPPGAPPPQGPMPYGQVQAPAPMSGGYFPPAPAGLNPNPPIKIKGFFRRRKICTQCDQVLDKTWERCPYCAEAAAKQQQPPPSTGKKTQAMVLDSVGAGSMQLLGWLVPLQGPQRGELYTLQPNSLIGTDPGACSVVLSDQFMSSKHAEIKAEGGTWVLRDLGSTNGTYVNDKRVDRHELVDNDFIRFGKFMVKFKCL